jgi:hypothetical protein
MTVTGEDRGVGGGGGGAGMVQRIEATVSYPAGHYNATSTAEAPGGMSEGGEGGAGRN